MEADADAATGDARIAARRWVLGPLAVAALLLGLVIWGGPPASPPEGPDGGWTPPAEATWGDVAWGGDRNPGPVTLTGDEAARWRAVRRYVEQGTRAADARARVVWLPAFEITGRELLTAARALQASRPTVTLWRGDFAHAGACLALVGQRTGARLDPDRLVEAARALPAEDPSHVGHHPTTLPFFLYVGNLGERLDALAAAQDDGLRPLVGDDLLALEERLARAVPPAADPYLERLSPAQVRSVRAGLVLRRLAVHLAALRHDAGRDALLEYVRTMLGPDRPPEHDWVR